MDGAVWKLRYKTPRHNPDESGEYAFPSEEWFSLGLQAAYRQGATDIVATMPDGLVLTEAVIRKRYPPR